LGKIVWGFPQEETFGPTEGKSKGEKKGVGGQGKRKKTRLRVIRSNASVDTFFLELWRSKKNGKRWDMAEKPDDSGGEMVQERLVGTGHEKRKSKHHIINLTGICRRA